MTGAQVLAESLKAQVSLCDIFRNGSEIYDINITMCRRSTHCTIPSVSKPMPYDCMEFGYSMVD